MKSVLAKHLASLAWLVQKFVNTLCNRGAGCLNHGNNHVRLCVPSAGSQDYYQAQFSLGEAGPPAYVVLTDVDYFAAFNNTDVRQKFNDLSTGLAQLQRCEAGTLWMLIRAQIGAARTTAHAAPWL